METPKAGEKVRFVLQGGPRQGQIRNAEIVEPWDQRNAPALARRYRRSVEEIVAEHGMRATVCVEVSGDDLPGIKLGLGGSFTVSNAEYSRDMKPGTWHRVADETPEM